jgi:hypothetical protein
MNEQDPNKRAGKNDPDYNLARNITLTGIAAGTLGIGVCIYGITYDHDAVTSNQEDLPPVECFAMNNLIDTVNDPDARPVDIENETMATSLVYSMRTDDENAIDNGFETQDAYDAIGRAGEFADALEELGDVTEAERQRAASPYLIDLTNLVEEQCA